MLAHSFMPRNICRNNFTSLTGTELVRILVYSRESEVCFIAQTLFRARLLLPSHGGHPVVDVEHLHRLHITYTFSASPPLKPWYVISPL